MGKRLSFKHCLLIAFLLMALLFAASLFIGIKTLEYLNKRSHETTDNAVTLNALSQELNDVSTAMERSSRQYVVLLKPDLQHTYQEALSKAGEVINTLFEKKVINELMVQQWYKQTQQITDIVTRQNIEPQEQERLQNVLLSHFQELRSTQLLINTSVQLAGDLRNQQLQEDISRRQRWMTQLMIGLLAVALFMAIGFGFWLARPFKHIQKAIIRLGENQFDQPIHINGPTDVRQLGRQLDWLRVRLAEIDDDKARFLWHTSHELKTPLAALREGISLLQEELAGALNRRQKDVVHILQQNAIVLQKQIEDLLHFNAAAFDARKLSRKPTNLLELAEDQVEAQQFQWQANHLDVRVTGESVMAEVDAEKLGMVLSNLLSNAIRFSPEHGVIEIQIGAQGQTAFIDIFDQGPGIGAQDQAYIFDPFYRGKVQPTNYARGSGIGLSIVQEYVIAHGGQIKLLTSETGAHFQIELPRVNII